MPATIEYGPLLLNPSSEGFSVWAWPLDPPATWYLDVRPQGTTNWLYHFGPFTSTTTYSVRAIPGPAGQPIYSIYLHATGLAPSTAYDYRVVDDLGTVLSSVYTTITLPPTTGGRMVWYVISDLHTDGLGPTPVLEGAYQTIYDDWTTNYLPQGIPAATAMIGDFLVTTLGGADDPVELRREIDMWNAGCGYLLHAQVPRVFMFDDWDWGSNNSNRYLGIVTYVGSPVLYPWDRVQELENRHNVLYGAQPRHAPPSYGCIFTPGGVPFILADSRSQKAPTAQYVKNQAGVDVLTGMLNGTEPYCERSQLYGAVQHEWLRTQLVAHARKGLIIFISTHTFKDVSSNLIPQYPTASIGGPNRDSCGIFHRSARNDLFSSLLGAIGGGPSPLVVVSGDDHWNVLWDYPLGDPAIPITRAGVTGSGIGLPLRVREFKLNSGTSQAVGFSPTVFGFGDWNWLLGGIFITGRNRSTVLRIDISSEDSGRQVEARFTFLATTNAIPPYVPGSIPQDERTGLPGDWIWHNFHLTPYSQYTPQRFPTASQPGPMTGTYGDIDAITGFPLPAKHVANDPRTQRIRDIGYLDDPSRDEQLERHGRRTEITPWEP